MTLMAEHSFIVQIIHVKLTFERFLDLFTDFLWKNALKMMTDKEVIKLGQSSNTNNNNKRNQKSFIWAT